MLLKGCEDGETLPWISLQGNKNKITAVPQKICNSVTNKTETTVMVYYQCEPIAGTKYEQAKRMRGATRVLTFFLLATCLPVVFLILPLYLRNFTFAERHYSLMKNDVITLTDGISSCFCQNHKVESLEGWFSAYSMQQPPKTGSEWQLKVNTSSMAIPDDRLEYWGFALLPGSTINLSVCAKNLGANLLIVRGERDLELCGLLNHASAPRPPQLPADDESIVIVHKQESTTEAVATTSQDIMEEENSGGEVTDKPETTMDIKSTTNDPPHLVRHLRSKLRHRREGSTASLDTKKVDKIQVPSEIQHGGNTVHFLQEDHDASSVSSFESDLLLCFFGNLLFKGEIKAGGDMCEQSNPSLWPNPLHLTQSIKSKDHYYYVFYSDNDLDNSTYMHARFEINSTKYDFSESEFMCNNVTNCTFEKSLFGNDGTVYIEAASDVSLISICEPRFSVYLMFLVSALILVLIVGLL